MKNWLKQNWFKAYLLAIIVVMAGGVFYWFEWRPAKIRHDCSWVKRHADAASEITQKQHDECIANLTSSERGGIYSDFLCGSVRSAQPAKDWWEEAIKPEYDFCIHERGL